MKGYINFYCQISDSAPYKILEEGNQQEALNWYKSLSVNQKLNIKEGFVLLCGIEWGLLTFIPLRDRITLMYYKLKREGILQ